MSYGSKKDGVGVLWAGRVVVDEVVDLHRLESGVRREGVLSVSPEGCNSMGPLSGGSYVEMKSAEL